MDTSCFIDIYNYWKINPHYWISIQNQQKADKDIYDKWFDILKPFNTDSYLSSSHFTSYEDLIGYIIYLDQLQVHFDRYLNNTKNAIHMFWNRKQCIKLLDEKNEDFWLDLFEDNLYFCLMPYKHLYKYDFCLNICLRWIKQKEPWTIKDFKILSKFYNDTYYKSYKTDCFSKVKYNIHIFEHNKNIYDYQPEQICEYYPEEFYDSNWLTYFQSNLVNKTIIDSILSLKVKYNHTYVSLSGGVDSMVILYLAKQLGLNVSAIHIVYGNREESEQELNFIQHYCNSLQVKLYYYRIINLKRNEIEREFYETMTRNIRFAVYRHVIGELPSACVILGHIYEDIIENIWTNFAKCQHIANLKKMEESEEQMGVQIVRPLLNIKKESIFEISKLFYIPYLFNTTPLWSNRGKFREDFYKATHKQFSSSVDSNIIKLAEILRNQSRIIEKLIYYPILDSFDHNNQSINITRAIEFNLQFNEWQYLIEKFCHEKLCIAKPSIHAIKQFVTRLNSNKFESNIMKFQMKHSYQFIICKNNDNYLLYLKKLSITI